MTTTTQNIPLSRRLANQVSENLVRYLVVLGVILVSGGIAFVSSPKISILVVGGIGALLVFPVLLRQPQLGVLALIPASLVIPLEISVSGGSSLNATMLLLIALFGLWVFDLVVRRGEINLLVSRTFTPLAVFVAVSIIAFILGQLHWFYFAENAPITAQLGGLAIFLLSAVAYFLVAHLIPSLVWLERLTWTFLGFGSVFVISQFIPVVDRLAVRLYPFGGLTSMFWTWMVALSFSQALFNEKMTSRTRLTLAGLTIATLYVAYTIVPGWKSGWVPAVITVGALLALRSRKLAVAGIFLGFLLVPILIPELLRSDAYSYSTRTEAWFLIAEIVKVNPILGLGPANYYWYTPLFPISGYSVNFNSHNQYVDLIAQTGLVGLLAFLWFFGEVGRLGWRLRLQAPAGFARAYVYAGLAGLVGTLSAAMFGDWVVPFVYNVGFSGFRASVYSWIFLGGLVALEKIVSPRENE